MRACHPPRDMLGVLKETLQERKDAPFTMCAFLGPGKLLLTECGKESILVNMHYRIPAVPGIGKGPCPNDRDKDKKQKLWMQTPYKVIPMRYLNDGYGLLPPHDQDS